MKKTLFTSFLLLFSILLSFSQNCSKPVVGQGTPGTGTSAGYDCRGLDLLSYTSYNSMGATTISGFQGNDSWGWTDVRDGKEYALIGLTNGLYFMDISNPSNPRALGRLPKPSGIGTSLWSDVKTYENWAFIVSESSSFGMQIFNLNRLQGLSTNAGRVFNLTTEANNNNYSRMTTIPGTGATLQDSHNIIINEDSGIAYILGANLGAGGPIYIGIDTSTAPPTLTFEGNHSGDGYTHDAQVVIYDGPDPDYQGREIMIASNEDEVTILDVTDEINGTGQTATISAISYPNFRYTHQGWFTDDKKYFILGDEQDEEFAGIGNTKTIIFDLTDLDNPVLQFNYQGRTAAIDHNGYVRDNRLYMANYTAGVSIKRIHNIDDPITAGSTIQENGSGVNGNMVEEAYFDTHTPDNNNDFGGGAWNLYPYFESGTLLVSNLEGGVFLLKQQNYDNQAPVAVCNGYTATLDKTTGSVTVTAADLAGDSTDNVGITKSTISEGGNPISEKIFTCADVGQTFTIDIEVEDDFGLKSTCTMAVTVEAEETRYTGGAIGNNGSWTNGLPGTGSDVRFDANATITSAANVEACVCTVDASRTVTVQEDAFLKVEKDMTINGTLTIEHKGSFIQVDENAAVIKGGSGTINVDITTPFMKPRDFLIMGSPMTAETRTGVFNPAFLVLNNTPENFNPLLTISTANGTNFADAEGDDWSEYASGPINVGEGYLVRPQMSYTDGNATYDMTYTQGTLNNGNVTRTIVHNSGTNGMGNPVNPDGTPNIIANPYPSAISASAFLADNPSIETIYFWEHLTPPNFNIPGHVGLRFDMDDISIYNSMGGLKAAKDNTMPTDPNHTKPNDVISTGQGFSFFADGTATQVEFNNSMRINTPNNTLTRPIDVNKIWLDVRHPRYEVGSSTLLGFTENATSGIDAGYDTPRLATIVSLYTMLDDESEKLSIQGRAPFTNETVVKLGFSTQIEKPADYTISISDLEGTIMEEATTVYLEDIATGEVVNLSESNYTFNAGSLTLDKIFLLKFESETVLDVDSQNISNVKIYPNPAKNILTVLSPESYIERIEVYDVRGRRMSQDIEQEQNSFTFNLVGLETSVYFIKIITQDGTVTKKLIKE